MLKKTELMRMLLFKYLHILQCLLSSLRVGMKAQSQLPTVPMPVFIPKSTIKYAAEIDDPDD